MRAHIALWIALTALVLAAATPMPPVAHRKARCLRLSYGPWTIGNETLDLYQPLPLGVALVDSLFWPAPRGRPAQYWAVRIPVAKAERRRSMWNGRRDSLELRFPSWWSTGLVMRFAGSGDTLHGRADVYVDYSPSEPTWAQVTAVSMKCPTRIPIPK